MEKQIKMRIFKEGENVKAPCAKCSATRLSTFHYRDYKSTSTKKVIHNVLQAFCNFCGSLTAIPDQSAPKISEQLKGNIFPVEVRISPQLEDVVYILGSKIGVEVAEITRMLLGFYAHELKKPATQGRLKRALKDELAEGKGTSRISLRILERLIHFLDSESAKLGINRSQLIKAILVQAKLDLLDHSESKISKRFFEAAHLMAA